MAQNGSRSYTSIVWGGFSSMGMLNGHQLLSGNSAERWVSAGGYSTINLWFVVGNMDLAAKNFDQVLVLVSKRQLACIRICNEIFVRFSSIQIRLFENHDTESFHAIEITYVWVTEANTTRYSHILF